MNTIEMIRESLRIEGIHRDPTPDEMKEHRRFLALPEVTIAALGSFVSTYASGNRLRNLPGLDVRIGNYYPMKGGDGVRQKLQSLLDQVNAGTITPWRAHVEYELLHPFTDGNGRSGRVLWYWMMAHPHGGPGRSARLADLGFLHAFYYQTLGAQES